MTTGGLYTSDDRELVKIGDDLVEVIPQKTTWSEDIFTMHDHYGVHDVMDELESYKLKKFLEFRKDFLQEELDEFSTAIDNADAEEIVDGCIDLCVVAIGTLDALGVDVQKAWEEVLKANMNKTPGIKPDRPNPLGLPDLIKPEGWVAPSHEGNHGFIARAFED